MLIEKYRSMRARAEADRKIPVYRSTVPRWKSGQDLFLAITFGTIILGAMTISGAHAQGTTLPAGPDVTIAQSAPSGGGERPGRPPREALEACANAKPQSACSFSIRKGETVKGKCMSPEANIPLACAPAKAKKS